MATSIKAKQAITPSNFAELGALVDFMRERGVASIQVDNFGLTLLEEALVKAAEEAAEPMKDDPPEEANPNTGLTPSEEAEWFHSAKEPGERR